MRVLYKRQSTKNNVGTKEGQAKRMTWMVCYRLEVARIHSLSFWQSYQENN